MDKLLNLSTARLPEIDLATRTSKIHVRTQQMGKKWITTVEGLDDDLDLQRISKAMKKAFQCGVVPDKANDGTEFIKIQGNHRDSVREWLIANEVLTEKEAKERLVLHGI